MSRRSLPLLAAGFLAFFPVFQAARASEGWLTSYPEALAVAGQTGRPVLTLFTGSDWCPHCKTLEHNVFASGAFRAWAEANVVLLMIDLPQEGISQAVRSERSQVCIKYGVRTFPSVLLLAADGSKIVGQTGYTGQSAETWLAAMSHHVPQRHTVAKIVTEDVVPEPVAVGPAAVEDPNPSAAVHDSLDDAVQTARGVKRPILLVVARPGDSKARSHSESLIRDPDFDALTRDTFVVAKVAPTAAGGSGETASLENLLGGADLPPESVEIIITEDGQTPLFSQSGTQPPARVVSGIRRFLAARQAARFR